MHPSSRPSTGAARRLLLALLAGCAAATGTLAAPGAQARGSEGRPAAGHDASPAQKPRSRPRHHGEDTAATSPGSPREAEARARVCTVDRELVNQQADANVSSNRRLTELRGAAQADLDLGRRQIELQLKGIDDELRDHPADAQALQKQRRAYEDQAKTLAARAGQYARRIEATRQTVTRQLTAATTPLVQGVARQQACGIVIAREAVVDMGDAVDISKAVIEAMNRDIRIQPFALVDLAER